MVAVLGDKTKGERGHIFQLWLKADQSPKGSERAAWSVRMTMLTEQVFSFLCNMLMQQAYQDAVPSLFLTCATLFGTSRIL